MLGLPAPATLRELRLHHPGQVKTNQLLAVDFVHLNTTRPPFSDVRVRQALNAAVDRGRIARLYGGPLIATPTCQPLTRGLLGYRRYCPYTARPTTSGAWRGADLARARHLVAASGTLGQRVDVWGARDQPFVPAGVSRYVADVLRALGYRVHLHAVPYETLTRSIRRKLQLSADGDWLPDYPAASSYLPSFFACHGIRNHGYFCDPGLDRLMARASSIQLEQPEEAARLWRAADRRLVDVAAWVPTVNLRAVEIVSSRVRNYQFNPIWGFVADQVWLR
jgi:peptide/nickel transport system substrate-binding protein